jgi:hypothetical protein
VPGNHTRQPSPVTIRRSGMPNGLLEGLTLCHSYLKPYCQGRKTAFFQWAFKLTYYTRKRSPLQEKKIITIKLKMTE